MSKKGKKIFAIAIAAILAAAMLVSLVVPYILTASAEEPTVDSMKDELEEIKERKKTIEYDLQVLEGEMASEFAIKAQLDDQIDVMGEEIEMMDSILVGIAAAIKQKEQEIVAMEESIEHRRELYAQRVKVTYEGGRMSYFEILLGADSFWDFFRNIDVVSRIIEADNSLVDGLQGDKEELERIRLSIEDDLAHQEAMRAEMVEAVSELERKREAADDRIAELERNESRLESAYADAEKAEQQLQDDIKKALEELAKKNTVYVGGEFIWPCPGYYEISDPFGMRFHPILKYNKLHSGTDVRAPRGAQIIAANSGKVVKAETHSAYGKYVLIDHGGGYATLYAHMSSISVSADQTVSQGQEVGLVGSTGWSTGNHLHFEIMINGDYKDPMTYFRKA